MPREELTSREQPGDAHPIAAKSDAPTPPVAAEQRERGFGLRRVLVIADAIAIACSLSFATLLDVGNDVPDERLWSLASVPAWILLFRLYGLYDRDLKRVSHSTLDDMPYLFHALIIGCLGQWAFVKIAMPTDRMTLSESITLFVGALVAVTLSRSLARALAHRATAAERVLVVGSGPMARLLDRKVRNHREYGLDLIGYVDLVADRAAGIDPGLPFLGTIAELERVCERHHVERVLALASAVDHEELANVIRRIRTLRVRISVVPDLVDVLGPSVEIDDIEGVTVLGINPPQLTRSSRLLKRALDLAVAIPALLILMPLFAIVAVAIRVTSPGPVVYSQERVGRNGRRFHVHKFRTMVRDADQRSEELKALSTHPAWLFLEHDPRITPVGHWLRRTSIDELPQLWNVLIGDMSLVGPRPMLPSVYEHISGWGLRRLDLTPGITGLWQVLGRTAIPFEEMVKLDYLYATNWSLWYDIRLLIRTLPAVLAGRGAN